MKKVNIIFTVFLCLCLVFSGCGVAAPKGDKIKITATLFSEYDFARAVAGDRAEVSLLIPPSSDMHTYEPTIGNIAGIENSDLFLYIGGESDTWVERILGAVSGDNLTVLKMSDYVCLADEHTVGESAHDHSHDDEEYDEHIWTSPDNAEKMIAAIKDALCEIDPESIDYYTENAENYITKIRAQADAVKRVIDAAEHKKIVVADRNPYKYFTDYYGLSCIAAFSGCAEDTDADLATVASLIETVKSENLKSVFVTELSNTSLANTVAENTGAKVLTLHSYHNISVDDFENGVTYVDLMQRNSAILAEGLN